MELELHQLELRYERLRKRAAARRTPARGLAGRDRSATAGHGGERGGAEFILIDGYKRVRALQAPGARHGARNAGRWRRSRRCCWSGGLRCASEDAFDQAWLLAELQERFALSLEELARRFEHSKSWVSRRLALIQALPAAIQEQVRAGTLERARGDEVSGAVGARQRRGRARSWPRRSPPLKPTSRQVGALYAGWQAGTARTRELILATPQIYLQAQATQEPARALGDAALAQRSGRPRGHCPARPPPARTRAYCSSLLTVERTEVSEAVRAHQGGCASVCSTVLIGRPAMLDEATRTAILQLHEQGHGSRAIAQALGVARCTVRRVIEQRQRQVPPLVRAEAGRALARADPGAAARYEGHLGRVHEELAQGRARLSYPALTAFCRRHGIGAPPRCAGGPLHFEPGAEMQHDTSPHKALIGGVLTRVQTASLVLCYSRMIFFQYYPRFTPLRVQGVPRASDRPTSRAPRASCMIDNTHVVVAAGTGAAMIPAPEMAAFAERYGFTLQGPREGRCQSLGAGRGAVPSDREATS